MIQHTPHYCHHCYGAGCRCLLQTHYYLGISPMLNPGHEKCLYCSGTGYCRVTEPMEVCHA